VPRERATLRRFGQAVRERRLELGYTQEDLSDIAQFDRTYISMVERGVRNPALLNIVRLAKALKVAPAVLVKDL
jgi:transcriptional regulator with XRE-family HTH domain